MNTSALIDEVSALPIEDRALVVQSLLLSLNQPEKDIDNKWSDIANKRLENLRTGRVNSVDGEKIFNAIWQRFYK